MELEALLRSEHSRRVTDEVVGWAGERPSLGKDRFGRVMKLVLGKDALLAQRASAAIGPVAEQWPELVEPYLPRLVDCLGRETLHVAVHRNALRALQAFEIPEEIGGAVVDVCIRMLEDPTQPVALKAYSVTIFARLSRAHPELQQELKQLLKWSLRRKPTAALEVRARRALAELD